MIAYITRDKNGTLYLHNTKPKLDKELEGYISEDFFIISDEAFPELKKVTYKNSPIEVEFNIIEKW